MLKQMTINEHEEAPPQKRAKTDADAIEPVTKEVPTEYMWFEVFDPETGKPYYINVMTEESRWDVPKAKQTQDADNQIENESKGPQLNGVSKHLRIYLQHSKIPSALELGRPARQQVSWDAGKQTSYIQGNDDYNIWYHKYGTLREEARKEREACCTSCNLLTDVGWTKADTEPDTDKPSFCLYFAKGSCFLGHKCRYYHRVPTIEDDDRLDPMHDIFGRSFSLSICTCRVVHTICVPSINLRERHANHRDDMTGVGSFNQECRCLFIGELRFYRNDENYIESIRKLLKKVFSKWGPLTYIKVIPMKNIAFIKYKYRAAAEFARWAMSDQKVEGLSPCLDVKWAFKDPNPKSQEDDMQCKSVEAQEAVVRRLKQLGYTEEDLRIQRQWLEREDSIGIYPDTDGSFYDCEDSVAGVCELSTAQFIPPPCVETPIPPLTTPPNFKGLPIPPPIPPFLIPQMSTHKHAHKNTQAHTSTSHTAEEAAKLASHAATAALHAAFAKTGVQFNTQDLMNYGFDPPSSIYAPNAARTVAQLPTTIPIKIPKSDPKDLKDSTLGQILHTHTKKNSQTQAHTNGPMQLEQVQLQQQRQDLMETVDKMQQVLNKIDMADPNIYRVDI